MVTLRGIPTLGSAKSNTTCGKDPGDGINSKKTERRAFRIPAE